MVNARRSAVRRKRITSEKAADFLGLLPDFDFRVAEGPAITDLRRLNAIAERHQLTSYDTAYLDLAKRLALPIATLDKDLRKAALAEGVAVL
jgi:predicted nucleic acid-binding protein